MSKASDDVLAERQRQIESEGFTLEHDDDHSDFSLAAAALCYAHAAATQNWRKPADYASQRLPVPNGAQDTPPWPKTWSKLWWKPKSPRHDLVRAAALLIAEIERLDREQKG